MPHIVISDRERTADDAAEDVWYAEASAGWAVAAAEDGVGDGDEETMDAVAMDNRERIKSNGYVVPSTGSVVSQPMLV